jgi:hypothetical protein
MSLTSIINSNFRDFNYFGIKIEAYTNKQGEIKKNGICPSAKEYEGKDKYFGMIWNKETGKSDIIPNAISIDTSNLSVIDVDVPAQCPILDKLKKDCKLIVKTNKGFHFYFKNCDELLKSDTGKKGITCGIADINLPRHWFCPIYFHNEDKTNYYSYECIKSCQTQNKLSEMPDYAVMWCNMLIGMKNYNSSSLTSPIINKKKSTIEKIIIQPDFQVEKFNIDIMTKIYDIYFKHNQFNNYDTWRNTAYMSRHLNNSEDCFQLFDKYSRKVQGYENKPECENRQVFFGKNEYNENYNENGILIRCSKLDPVLFNSSLVHLYKSKYEDDFIKINSMWLYPETKELDYIYNDWNQNFKCLMFKSAYGTGKTYGFKKIIETYEPKKILFITYRQSLAHSLTNDLKSKFGFNSYLDKTVNIKTASRIIIQLDSIYKLLEKFQYDLQHDTTPEFDLVVLDEMEGLLNHLSYNKIDQHTIFNILERIIKKSNKVLCLDGDLNDRSLDFISNMNISFKVYKNEFKPNKKNFIFTNDMEKFNNNIDEDLKNGKKIVIVCMTKTESEKYNDMYKENYKVIIHNSIEKNKNILLDVNSNWADCDLLIYSPSVESGVDFNIKNNFYKCYSTLSNQSTSFRAFNQMLNRVRFYENNNIMCYFDSKMMEFSTIISPYVYEEMKLYKYSQIEDSPLVCTLIHNDVESINSKNYFIPSLIKSIIDKGHTYQYLNDAVKIEKNKEDKSQKEIIIEHIVNAKNLEEDEYVELIERQRANEEITREETYQINKMYYKKVFLLEHLDFVNSEFMDIHYNNVDTLKNNKLINIALEDRNKISKDEILKTFKFNKIDMMHKIINTIGFDVFNKDIMIEQDTYEKQKDKVIEILNSKEYKTLFNCGKRVIKKERFSLKSLLETYGLTIVSELHRKQINKVSSKSYTYKLCNLEFINQYYKRLDDKRANDDSRISSCEFLDD